MSKKIILISILSAGMLFSCRKAEIVPGQNTSYTSTETVTKNSASNGGVVVDTDVTITEMNNFNVSKDDRITDPNNDEDRNKKKKGVN